MHYTKHLSPELRKQYRYLQIYSFFRFWFLGYWIVFQPLYFLSIGFSLTEVLLNAAIAPILSLVFQNTWSKIVDQTQNVKKYILIGDLAMALASTMTFHVDSFFMMIIITFIAQCAPNSNSLSAILVYNLSDKVTGISDDLTEKRYHNINLFARYRRFGSIGWAIGLPIMGLILNITGLGINFFICSIGLIFLTIWFFLAIKEKIILTSHHPIEYTSCPEQVIPIEKVHKKSSLLQNYRKLFKNRIYFSFIFASLFYAIAFRSTISVQGLFYNIFSNDNYFILVWVYSIAALAEWPVMTIVAKQVKKIGWKNVIIISYILSGIRMIFMPFIVIFFGNIYWGYLLQITAGILFGLRWPSATFGIYISLPKDQKAIGQSFSWSIELIGGFLGGIIGAAISMIILDENLNYFYIHWIAGIIAIISGLVFIISIRKYRDKGTKNPPQK